MIHIRIKLGKFVIAANVSDRARLVQSGVFDESIGEWSDCLRFRKFLCLQKKQCLILEAQFVQILVGFLLIYDIQWRYLHK